MERKGKEERGGVGRRESKMGKGVLACDQAGDPQGIIVTLYSGTYYGLRRSCGVVIPTTDPSKVIFPRFLFCIFRLWGGELG